MSDFQELDSVVVRFAGDSGDGMQVVGEQFTDSSALAGNDISTFPDFPAEIRAPIGTLPGVSGFQIKFGNQEVLTPGDRPDALVAMNPAALKVNIDDLPDKGLLIVNTDSFNESNLKKAGYDTNPLETGELKEKFQLIEVNITQMAKDALSESDLKPSMKARCKNFFALGFLYWIYDRPMDFTLKWIQDKWSKAEEIVYANQTVLKAGYYFGETTEAAKNRYQISKAAVEPGIYRKISGNEAIVLGLIAASQLSDRRLLFSGYPITPASAILEGLAKHKNFSVKTVQAEDEIAAIGVAMGASFTGQLGVTATSGPGICLKSEFIGLALSAELPIVICDIQRGGPSTGLPTKTEQSDLLLAMYGRHGESPVPIVAASSPSDCFDAAIEATRIALTYNTPVFLMSDGYVANGSEPWKIPDVKDLKKINVQAAKAGDDYVIFKRDPETLARKLAYPGTPGLEHRIGGLEKSEDGSVSYDAINHEEMTHLRASKVQAISKSIPPLEIYGKDKGQLLVLGWGGTYGAITSAVKACQEEGLSVSSIHLKHLNPFPDNLGDILNQFDKVLIPELNLGQLSVLIRDKFLIDAISFNKVQGKPFTISEMKEKIQSIL